MRTLSRSLRQWEPVRVGAAAVGVAGVFMLAAYVLGAVSSQPSIEGVVSAVAFLAIAGTGFLYAWRLGAGGTLE
jgi:hypothetical protein